MPQCDPELEVGDGQAVALVLGSRSVCEADGGLRLPPGNDIGGVIQLVLYILLLVCPEQGYAGADSPD